MAKRAIVLVIDRLGASHLGPYGNTLFPTPGFNRLGSTSWLCERTIADAPDLASAYRAWLTGRHALCPAGQGGDLCQRLAAQGIGMSLLTDDAAVSELAAGYEFSEMSELPTTPPVGPAEEIAATQTAEFFGALIDQLADLPASHLLWAHTRGLAGAWDAPQELREMLVAEGDPPPYAGLTPPHGVVESGDAKTGAEADHAERWPLVCSHAAQLLVVDACLEALLDALDVAGDSEALLVVTSPRGFPLGEHGAAGETASELHEELLHLPLFIKLPGEASAAARGAVLGQPADLAATLAAWFESEPFPVGGGGMNLLPHVTNAAELPADRECAVAVRERKAVLHTPHWCWHGELASGQEEAASQADPHAADPLGRLFVKPDDRWEVNEIASRCPDIAAAMQVGLDRFAQLAAQGKLHELPTLAEEL